MKVSRTVRLRAVAVAGRRGGAAADRQQRVGSMIDLQRGVVDPKALMEETFEFEADRVTVVPRMHQDVG